MPFQFTKTAPASAGGASYKTTRSAPSSAHYVAYTSPSLIMMFVVNALAAAATSIYYFVFQRHAGIAEAHDHLSVFIPLTIPDMIPLSIPTGAISVISNFRVGPRLDFFTRYFANTPRRIHLGAKSFQIHEFFGLTPHDVVHFIGMEKDMNRSYQAISDTLTPTGMKAHFDILSVISSTVTTLFYSGYNSLKGQSLQMGSIENFLPLGSDDVEYEPIAREQSVRTRSHIEMKGKVSKRDCYTNPKFVYVGSDETTLDRAYGTMDQCPFPGGITLPFNRNLSVPDIFILSMFMNEFSVLFDKHSLNSMFLTLDLYLEFLQKWWKKEVCNTRQGEMMAHMMASLVLAKRCQASIYFVIEEGTYSGAVLGDGKWTILAHDQVFRALSGDEFTAEKRSMDAHRTTLKEILSILKIQTPPTYKLPSSLRILKDIYQPLEDSLSGLDKNKISELLPSLSFPQRPTSVNDQSIRNTVLCLLSQETIDKNAYLPVEEFFTVDNDRLILSRFGRGVPTLRTGNTLTRFSRFCKGAGSVKAPPFNVQPPRVFQVALVPLFPATKDWKQVLSSGLISIDGDKEVQGQRFQWRGNGAAEMWSFLTGELDKKLSMPDPGESDKRKRRQETPEEGELLEAPPAKKVFSMFDF